MVATFRSCNAFWGILRKDIMRKSTKEMTGLLYLADLSFAPQVQNRTATINVLQDRNLPKQLEKRIQAGGAPVGLQCVWRGACVSKRAHHSLMRVGGAGSKF